MSARHMDLFEVLKAATLILLAVLLFSLGSATRVTSLGAYLSFSVVMTLQGLEMFAPVFSERTSNLLRRVLYLRISILLQLVLASILVAVTDGSGSILLTKDGRMVAREVRSCESSSSMETTSALLSR